MHQGEWGAVMNFWKRLDHGFEPPNSGLFSWTVLPNVLLRDSFTKLRDDKGDHWILRDKFEPALTEVIPCYVGMLTHWKGRLQGRVEKVKQTHQLCSTALVS